MNTKFQNIRRWISFYVSKKGANSLPSTNVDGCFDVLICVIVMVCNLMDMTYSMSHAKLLKDAEYVMSR